MDKRIPLAALLVLCALPASADFCAWKDGRDDNGVFRMLDQPACKQDNSFVFMRASPPQPESWSRDGSTHVTSDMPGFMGADVKCKKAVAGAKVLGFRTESFLVAWALSGARVFKYKSQCSTLKYKFMEKYAELERSNPKGADNAEAALEAVGAEEVGPSAMMSRLIEVAEQEAAKEAAKRDRVN